MKWIRRLFLLAIMAYLLLCVGIYFFQTKLLFHPEPLDKELVYESTFEFKEFLLDTKDGNQINAVIYPGLDAKKGWILYFHGNGRNMPQWMRVVEELLPYGYGIMLMDYRQYGKSSGEFDEEKMIDDALRCYDFLQQRNPGEDILLYGRSMGTGFATQVAAQRPAKKLILESPYKSILSMSNYRFPFLPNSLLLRFPLRTDLAAKSVNCPVLIMHGTADQVIPFEQGEALAQEFKTEQMSFVPFPNARHENMMIHENYAKNLSAFLMQ